MAIITSKELYLSIKDRIKIGILKAAQHENIKILTDKEFLELADSQDTIYTLSEFIEIFNKDSLPISSDNTYIRIL